MSNRINSIPTHLVQRSEREAFIKWLKEQEIPNGIKQDIYRQWSNEINQPPRAEDLQHFATSPTPTNGEEE